MTIRKTFDGIADVIPNVTVTPFKKPQTNKNRRQEPRPEHSDGTVDLEEAERFRLFMLSNSSVKRRWGVRHPEIRSARRIRRRG